MNILKGPTTSEAHEQSTEPVISRSDVDVLNVLEERVEVSKRTVDSGGGVRLRKLVHRDAVNVSEPLLLETLQVKRVSIGREVEGPVAIRYEGDVTVFPVLEERLITRKQLILVEEIHVTKLSQTDRSSQRVTLRREEIIAERQDPTSGEWSALTTADGGTPS